MSDSTANATRANENDRRAVDRRSGAERRRNSEPPVAAIEIGDSTLNIAVVFTRANGEKIVTTKEVPWRREAESLHAGDGEAELLAAMQGVASEFRLAGAALRVALGGSLCVTRSVVGGSDDVNREIQESCDRSRMYLTLGGGRKAVATCVSPLDARHKHTLMTVANQSSLDVVARVADSCGLKLQSIESAQAAICRLLACDPVLTGETALVLHSDCDQVHIAAVGDGRLLIDYRPSGYSGLAEIADLVAQHHHRIGRYCQRHFGISPDSLSRLLIVGSDRFVSDLVAKSRNEIPLQISGVDLSRLKLPWQWTNGPPESSSAAAVGAALGEFASSMMGFPDLIDNISDVKRVPMWPTLLKLASPLAACLLVAAGVALFNFRLQSQIGALQAGLDAIAPTVERSEQLRGDLVAGRQELEQLQQLATGMANQPWRQLIDGVGACMPEDVWLRSMSISDLNRVSLAGSSYSESGIYDFVGYLQHLPATEDVALLGTSSAVNAGAVVTSFELEIVLGEQQTTPAASIARKSP